MSYFFYISLVWCVFGCVRLLHCVQRKAVCCTRGPDPPGDRYARLMSRLLVLAPTSLHDRTSKRFARLHTPARSFRTCMYTYNDVLYGVCCHIAENPLALWRLLACLPLYAVSVAYRTPADAWRLHAHCWRNICDSWSCCAVALVCAVLASAASRARGDGGR